MTVSLLADDPDDRRLLGQVRPADWVNPSPVGRYNLVVIGGGPAGLVCAAGAAGLGARVALIERGLLGGDCLNTGCVPSKALLRCARAARQVRDAEQFGIRLPGVPEVDFAAVMARLRRLRADLSPNDAAERFRALGVDVFLGDARFTGPDRVEVAGSSLHFSKAILATGSRPHIPDIAGLASVEYLTNESVFALTKLPARLAVLGGGPVGCELAQAFARLGSRVTLLHDTDHLLPRDEPAASAIVADALRRDGVEILYNTQLARVERDGEQTVLHLPSGPLAVDRLLIAAGRQPNVESLGLEAAGVMWHDRLGVIVDDRLRTHNPRIYAAGDVCSLWKFTHAADALARIAVQNALFLGRRPVSTLTVPWCTYTDPEVAQVGLTEADAANRRLAVQRFVQPLAHVDRAVLDGEAEGFVQVLVRAGTDRLVGATVVAAHAGELIGELSLAMTNGLGLSALARTIHPYPTQAEALRKLGDAYNRTRLRPWIKNLLERWLAWNR